MGTKEGWGKLSPGETKIQVGSRSAEIIPQGLRESGGGTKFWGGSLKRPKKKNPAKCEQEVRNTDSKQWYKGNKKSANIRPWCRLTTETPPPRPDPALDKLKIGELSKLVQ